MCRSCGSRRTPLERAHPIDGIGVGRAEHDYRAGRPPALERSRIAEQDEIRGRLGRVERVLGREHGETVVGEVPLEKAAHGSLGFGSARKIAVDMRRP